VRVEDSTISSTGDVALSKTLVFPKPRLVVTWTPDAADQMRIRVEREVGQLDFNNFVANAALNGNGVAAGNPNLSPQQDWAFEAAWDHHFWNDGVVSMTVRRLELIDVIDRAPVFAPSGVFDEPANIGGGGETDIVGSFNLPLSRFGVSNASLWGSGTWRMSKVTDPTTGETRPISALHPLDAELHFRQDLPARKMSWGVDSAIGNLSRLYRFDEIDSTRIRTVNTVYVEWRPRPDLTIHAGVDTGVQIQDVTRQVYGGARSVAPLEFTDVREHRFGLLSTLRIRKTFN
jgi:outer membrane receptor protein involved in Fe transport